jgi:hypothetical protein
MTWSLAKPGSNVNLKTPTRQFNETAPLREKIDGSLVNLLIGLGHKSEDETKEKLDSLRGDIEGGKDRVTPCDKVERNALANTIFSGPERKLSLAEAAVLFHRMETGTSADSDCNPSETSETSDSNQRFNSLLDKAFDKADSKLCVRLFNWVNTNLSQAYPHRAAFLEALQQKTNPTTTQALSLPPIP